MMAIILFCIFIILDIYIWRSEMVKPMPKYPCRGCVYFKVCGESTRTEPCYGRMTKRERRVKDG